MTTDVTTTEEVMDPDVRQAFLEGISQGLTPTKAAQRAQKPRLYFYHWRRMDHTFKVEWDDANEQGADLLEEEARRRAVNGVETPVYDKDGNLKYTKVEYSDTLLHTLLKAARPAKFRESFRPDASDDDMSNPGSSSAMERLTLALEQVAESISKQTAKEVEAQEAKVIEAEVSNVLKLEKKDD